MCDLILTKGSDISQPITLFLCRVEHFVRHFVQTVCLNFLPVFSQDNEEMDLEMLAPYISMDDDFQLTFLSSLPEEDDKRLSLQPELSAVTPVGTVGRKR